MATYWSKDPSTEVKAPAITPAQLRLLQFYREYSDQHGYSPTMREISARFGWSSLNWTMDLIHRLCRRGALVQSGKPAKPGVKTQSRTVTITPLGRELTNPPPRQPTGTVIPEKRCPCGAAHFLDQPACAACTRGVVS